MRKGELLYKFGSRTSAYSNIQKYSFIRDAKKSVLSVGHIYSIFTFLLGFTPGSDEGKVEALAAFSEKDETLKLYYDLVSATEIQNCSISFTDNINEIFDDMYIDRLLVENNKVSIAYSVQKYLEFVMLRLVQQVVTMLKTDRIVLCGGVCANVIMNKKIFDNIVRDIYIFPAMGDDGLAAGAWAACADKNNFEYNIVDYDMPYYGPSYSAKDTVNVLNQYKGKVQYQELGNDFDKKIAELVSLKKIGALFMGRMEYGPRSLGNRSIIADVRDKGIHKKMNLQIKKRPEFQPFCPSILDEERSKLFKESYLNKHMTCAFDLKEEYYETLPGICHVDGTARVQFVTEKTNEKLYRILKEVKKITGYGALINTSFNKHGRTIVNTPEDAIIDFIDTDLDFLFMNGFLIKRN
jgi:carbamoyltransferase